MRKSLRRDLEALAATGNSGKCRTPSLREIVAECFK